MTYEEWWEDYATKRNPAGLTLKDAFDAGYSAGTDAANSRAGDASNEAEKEERREVAVDKLAELYESDGWNGKTVDAIIKEAQG